jgi:transposase
MEEVIAQAPEVKAGWGSETMLAPQEVQRMSALRALGWGAKRISAELGCSRNTVREYLRCGGWKPMDVSRRCSVVGSHREWLAERLRQHRGNADVVRQDLKRELGVSVSLRTVQRAVEPLRRELRAEALATVRYETAPGQQLQIDFGSTGVAISEEVQRIHLFVATLGYSRRCYVGVFLHERQSAWLQGLEDTLRHFGGVPYELLLDNAKALVDDHNRQTREVKFNDRFHAFCRYWGVIPRACAPYRARGAGRQLVMAAAKKTKPICWWSTSWATCRSKPTPLTCSSSSSVAATSAARCWSRATARWPSGVACSAMRSSPPRSSTGCCTTAMCSRSAATATG